MGERRRDSRNRVLRQGETQKPNGQYVYSYLDSNGKKHFLYSWKLERTDKIPAGKRDCEALRDKIKKIDEDVFAEEMMTVSEMVENYISMKRGVRSGTKDVYRTVRNQIGKDPLAIKRIDRVKPSDVKLCYIRLQSSGLSFGSVKNIHSVLRPAFQTAVEDDLIAKNPCNISLTDILQKDWGTREALTETEEQDFMEFLKRDRYFGRYWDEVYVLLHTGLRISEFAGLTVDDIDFEHHCIIVDHQLNKRSVNRQPVLYVEPPKSAKGYRQIPMTDEVEGAFRRIITKNEPFIWAQEVDGVNGFIVFGSRGSLTHHETWAQTFESMRKKYARVTGKSCYITPHICRHTFCSRMAALGMNPKTLQYIMGHASISVTMNVYTHLTFMDAAREMRRVVNQ